MNNIIKIVRDVLQLPVGVSQQTPPLVLTPQFPLNILIMSVHFDSAKVIIYPIETTTSIRT